MPVLLSIIYLFIAVYGTKKMGPRHTNFGTFSLFSIFAFIYYVGLPLECYITGNYGIYKGTYVDLSSQKFIITLAILALIGFYYGLKYSNFTPLSLLNKNLNTEKRWKWKAGMFFIVMAPFILLVFYRDEIILSSSYAGNYKTIYTNPFYSLLLEYSFLSISILNGYKILVNKKIKLINLILCFLVIYWGLYSSNKDPIIISLFPFLLYFVINPPKKSYYYIFYFFGSIISAISLLLFFSIIRKDLSVDFEILKHIINTFGIFRFTDPAGPMHVFFELLIDNKNFTHQFGKTYLNVLYNWIPKFIWPDRWLDPAQTFARENIKNWSEGQGMGYSLLAESYLNFNYLGPIIQYFMIGYLWGKIWNFFKIRLSKINYHIWLSIYYTLGTYILFVMHRAFFGAIFKQLILILVPIYLATVVFNKFIIKKNV